MSMLLMVQAMKVKVGSAARKLVLLKLADNANDEGLCWPSYENIAAHCEMDRRTVMRHIKTLSTDGFLSITHRKREDSKLNKSNVYQLTLAGGDKMTLPNKGKSSSDKMTLPSDRVSLGSDPVSPLGGDPVSPRTSHSFESVKEPIPLNPQDGESEFQNEKLVISYLNESKEKLASSLGQHQPRGARAIKSNLRKISARLKDGFTVKDCELVIDYLHQRWGHDQSMAEYFVLGSVFVASKFEDKVIKAQAWADSGRPAYRYGAWGATSSKDSSVEVERGQEALQGLLNSARTLEG